MQSRCITLLAGALLLAGLGGCAATGQRVERDAQVSDSALREARYRIDATRDTNALLYRLSVAAAAECAQDDAVYRAPFSLLYNDAAAESAELRSAVFRVAGIAELPALQAHSPALQGYDGAHVVSINRTAADNAGKTLAALQKTAAAHGALELAFEDGRTLAVQPQPACPSLVFTDYSGRLKEAVGAGHVELTPKAWLQVTHGADERAFVLARSIYFTGAEGEARLRHALYGGAAVSGVLRGLTFGLSALVVEPKTLAVRARRSANRLDADAFALRVMTRAGFDPHAAVALARRSLDEGGAWPGDCDELRFDAGRLAALERGAAGNGLDHNEIMPRRN